MKIEAGVVFQNHHAYLILSDGRHTGLVDIFDERELPDGSVYAWWSSDARKGEHQSYRWYCTKFECS